MINLTKGSTSSVYLTLWEKSELTNPYYLFEFTSNDTGNATYATTDDWSDFKPRMNVFTFSVMPGSATAGYINLEAGTYDYVVYETEYQYNLNVASASNVVEIGLVTVNGTVSTFDETYTDTDDDTEYVYGE